MYSVAIVCNQISVVLFSFRSVNLTKIEALAMLIHLDKRVEIIILCVIDCFTIFIFTLWTYLLLGIVTLVVHLKS
jgi:hypothetical protein